MTESVCAQMKLSQNREEDIIKLKVLNNTFTTNDGLLTNIQTPEKNAHVTVS